MFGVLVIEQGKEPLTVAGLPATIQHWVLTAGAVSGAALALWLIYKMLSEAYPQLHDRLFAKPHPAREVIDPLGAMFRAGGRGFLGEVGQGPGRWLLHSLLGGVGIALVVAALPRLWVWLGWSVPEAVARSGHARGLSALADMARSVSLLFLASLALAAITVPILHNLPRLRVRRIWAIARLSIKEAVRSKVLWAFSFLLLIFLFGSWFLPSKSERQLQTYVETVFAAMAVLLLIPAALLASFSIPTDLRRQTIHTIVTKPVERFEIVLGRVLGYALLMSGVLLVMTTLSLIYVVRGVDEEARAESFRARVPVYGDLKVLNGKKVGREWEYRNYIGYFGTATERRTQQAQAFWRFHQLPSDLAGGGDKVRLEFEFDIFRTTKGEEGKPVLCSLAFYTPRWDPSGAKLNEYKARRYQYGQVAPRSKGSDARGLPNRPAIPVASSMELASRLAEEYGYYEIQDQGVVDYHTMSVDLPAALFKGVPTTTGADEKPPLTIVVECRSPNQFLGVAQHDLYLLAAERSVWLNFFKGSAGIWFLMCLVIGVSVTCSTYLSGIISVLVTFVLLLVGLVLPYVSQLVHRDIEGPMQSLLRLGRPEVPISKPLDDTPVVTMAKFGDAVFSVSLRLVQSAFPDVKHYSLTDYVARGFDISVEKLLIDDLLPLFGYLFLWGVLAFYLIKGREIAA
jgi:ABC-type transport system involved in multi-copper enzyme maturation permease subunit